MIMTVAELKTFISTTESDSVLEAKLQALESLIRSHTNNNFQNRNIRFIASTEGSRINGSTPFILVGDTVQISESGVNDGIYTVTEVHNEWISVDHTMFGVDHNLITKVEYPPDVKMGVVSMMKWDLENRDKVGIASETISRHTVSYFSMDGDNSSMGFPKSLIGFLKPYMKARF